jgi:hypothetical protein
MQCVFAGDGWRDDTLVGTNQFMPGIVPGGRQRPQPAAVLPPRYFDSQHRVNWNFLSNLPIGKGRMIGRDSGRLLNALIGGWQVAGYGSLISRYFQLPTATGVLQSSVQVYGKKYRFRIAVAASAMTAGCIGTATFRKPDQQLRIQWQA